LTCNEKEKKDINLIFIPGYQKTLEWTLGCVQTNNIIYKHHGKLLTGQRERYIVVYPLSNMMIRGDLSKSQTFSSFKKDSVLVLCNFRIARKLRPDLLAISSRGDILVVEAKLRRKSDGTKTGPLKRLKDGSKELLEYALKLESFAKENIDNAYAKWNDLYHKCYTEKLDYPSLYQTVLTSLSIASNDQPRFFKNLNRSIANKNVKYALAFNGPRDQESYFGIHREDYDEIPKSGLDISGYDIISKKEIIESANSSWNNDFGELFLFMVNHLQSKFKML